MMKIIKIIFTIVALALLLFLVVLIGIPTYLFDITIDQKTIAYYEQVQDSIQSEPYYFKSEHYYESDTSKTMYLKSFTPKGAGTMEVKRPKECVVFIIKESYNNSSIVGSYEMLCLVFDKNAKCPCRENPFGMGYTLKSSVKLKENWYKVVLTVKQRYLHA
jgi:hypothetical protein